MRWRVVGEGGSARGRSAEAMAQPFLASRGDMPPSPCATRGGGWGEAKIKISCGELWTLIMLMCTQRALTST